MLQNVDVGTPSIASYEASAGNEAVSASRDLQSRCAARGSFM